MSRVLRDCVISQGHIQESKSSGAQQAHEAEYTSLLIRPTPPFRLDLTAWALQRRPGNLIDRWDGNTYHRVMMMNRSLYEIIVTQTGIRGGMIRVAIKGKLPDRKTKLAIRQAVMKTFGVGLDLSAFHQMAARDLRLAPLARRFIGLKPPRFFSVFEGLVNGIACQQLSLSLGIQLLNRLAQNFGPSAGGRDTLTYAFPRPSDLAYRQPEELRSLGFNFQKARAIIQISQAVVERKLNLESLTGLSDEKALSRLMKLRGVGRWTAEYTLLRGMGRWHVFPADDQGARNGLARWLRLRQPLDARRAQAVLTRWKPYEGMIYFYMLLKGLEKAGYLFANPNSTADARL